MSKSTDTNSIYATKEEAIKYSKMQRYFRILTGLLLLSTGFVSYGQQSICHGTATSVYKVDALENGGLGTIGSVYVWTVLNTGFSGTIGYVNPPSTNQVTVNWGNTPPGTYTIQVQEKDAVSGCLGPVQQLTVNLKSAPQPNLADTVACVNPVTGVLVDPVLLNSGVPQAGNTFLWTLNNMPLSGNSNTLVATQPGNYAVTVTHTATGCSGTDTATIGVSSVAVAYAVVKEAFELYQAITVTVTQGSGDYEYQLNDGPFQSEPVFYVNKSGSYTINVRDTKGCGEVPLKVNVLNYPRYFTPNGDSYHDTWNITGLPNPEKAKITIFDRYGKVIKQISPKGRGWDGTYNGNPLPSTDYWFVLDYYEDGVQKEFKAHFSMKR